jgi:hypothetical protein
MAGKSAPKSKSELGSAAGYKRTAASTKGVKVGVNKGNVKTNIASITRNSKKK